MLQCGALSGSTVRTSLTASQSKLARGTAAPLRLRASLLDCCYASVCSKLLRTLAAVYTKVSHCKQCSVLILYASTCETYTCDLRCDQ
jgi:hypothetical protein